MLPFLFAKLVEKNQRNIGQSINGLTKLIIYNSMFKEYQVSGSIVWKQNGLTNIVGETISTFYNKSKTKTNGGWCVHLIFHCFQSCYRAVNATHGEVLGTGLIKYRIYHIAARLCDDKGWLHDLACSVCTVKYQTEIFSVQKAEVWYFTVQIEQARSIIRLLCGWISWVCGHMLFARIKSAIVSFKY